MKKIQLSIPTPCHENWNEMKPEEKGRFCGFCQKTVIDFTNMSDRQLAEFFKKPIGSTCGRFHQDQLERPIGLPKKRIPWIKYFFTIAIPAFLASFKFAGRESTVGEMQATEVVKNPTIGDTTAVSMLPTVGMITMPIDSVPAKKQQVRIDEKLEPENIPIDTLSLTQGRVEPMPIEDVNDTAVKEGPLLEEVNITGYGTCNQNIRMGGLVSSRVVVESESGPLTKTPKQTIEALAYPNPIKAGGQLTVSLKSTNETIKQVQLFSPAGALINLQQGASFKSKTLVVKVPSSLAAGTYFLQIVSEAKQTATIKILILN